MKAITSNRFGQPEVLQLQDVARPTPKSHEVLIRIHASTVCKEDPDMRDVIIIAEEGSSAVIPVAVTTPRGQTAADRRQ